jgi:hypothetical protein
LLLCFPPGVRAQWEPDVRLTFDSSASYTSISNARCISAGDGGLVHVVWWDNRDRNYEIYYKRSTDAGRSWFPDARLTYALYDSDWPSVDTWGSWVHVVWRDLRDGDKAIYYKRSSDAGVGWSPDRRLSDVPDSAWNPSVSVAGLLVHVVWVSSRTGDDEIYYKRSSDAGLTWSPDLRLTVDTCDAGFPSVFAQDTLVHVVWWNQMGRNTEIFYKRSTDAGLSWSVDQRLTADSGISITACVAASGPLVHVAWKDNRDGNEEIYYKRSTDYGSSWGPDVRLSYDPGYSWNPSLAVSGPLVHLTWHDLNPYRIHYKRSANGGTDWGPDTLLTISGLSRYASLSVSGTALHAVWFDARDGNHEIYYKRNPTGNSGMEDSSVSFQPPILNLYPSVVPNPFVSFTSVPGHSSERFTLYDISGRKVGVYKGNRIGEGLSPGVYFLKYENKDTKPLRIVKLR